VEALIEAGLGLDYEKLRLDRTSEVWLVAGAHLPGVSTRLEVSGWIYRGDAGANGGQVFVLEARPRHRVAHVHVVEYGGAQWLNYLRLRDLLRRSPEARTRYEAAKLRLVDECGDDRKGYTDGKFTVVTSLLGTID
jgi:GrpB-like predicted nucleotidyltransferase (UPF0157 family)